MSGNNPNTALQSLFPAEVATEEMAIPALVENLHPAERACIDGAGGRRRLDFAGGRVCARRALAKLGIGVFPLLTGEKGEPVWPTGVVGSISHSSGRCAAAVARRQRIRSLGLDLERLGPFEEGVIKLVCTAPELEWVRSLPGARRPMAVSLLFSAKECFYKCQFSLTRRWLDFHDVDIRVFPEDKEFEPTGPACSVSAGVAFSRGRYLVSDGYIITGLTAHILEEAGGL
jgi:4'-phosphopantetheinyl transferase EntD